MQSSTPCQSEPWTAEQADEIVERLRESPELRYELLAREPALRSLIEAIAALAPASK